MEGNVKRHREMSHEDEGRMDCSIYKLKDRKSFQQTTRGIIRDRLSLTAL